jgi:hypothetical protein
MTSVVRLLFSCSPADIFYLIVTVVVDPIQAPTLSRPFADGVYDFLG